ncbi:D-alanine--D-alanine ligase family protein [Desulfotignum phosphitoxidans]|uniref:D-alanine--D-alanine ligase Ddl n=1 Tax=Desulfotignum phosphitoxidans DSM 13687 TaxID=1286635 RepID=S0FYF6_9BACT|nr:D-alanine--D-alanine ligase Ddl [Desulfotignum phosphitoxidans]EMS79710.1 D-alanine--D-alanine ligase Ddl [Desulfotignum phosphitoxidans DSM 13687]
MIIGLTYDLRQDYLDQGYTALETAEFDSVETIEAIEQALGDLGHTPVRIGNARQLTQRLVAGDRWDLVFNIAEGLHGMGREAQVPAILDLYQIPYTFSDPLVMSLTLHKALTKRVIRDAGLSTGRFFLAPTSEDAGRVPFDPPYFVKPVAQGTGMGITIDSVIQARQGLPVVCRALQDQFNQPVLIEEFLSGREFTTGLVGTGARTKVMGTMEIIVLADPGKDIYSFENKEGWKGRVQYLPLSPEVDPLIKMVEALALAAWQVLECRDAGRIDIRCDDTGTPCFIEVNPLAGLRPHYSDLPMVCEFFGTSYVRLIDMILTSAMERVPNHIPASCPEPA